jgi:hypothetical protein
VSEEMTVNERTQALKGRCAQNISTFVKELANHTSCPSPTIKVAIVVAN